jgi:2-polyprenyl-6-methoxyphenol hydroxylase-like FAD-dependent oxidoreductase
MRFGRSELVNAPDVIILGGGPAGCATALSLRSYSPSLSIALIEESSYEKPRVGEVLPGVARPLLDQLGVWKAFDAERYQPTYSTTAFWGSSSGSENHFIYNLQGAGWNLDRVRFDALLAAQAAECGTDVHRGLRFAGAERSTDRWRLSLSDGARIECRFVVDATGRRAAFGRTMKARMLSFDRLMGFTRFFELDGDSEPGTLIEAFQDGWWYTAPAGRFRAATCMTDSDIGRNLELHDRDQWLSLLSKTNAVRSRLGRAVLHGAPVIRAANSAHLDPVCGTDWLAVGDAASAFDPLSSHGIVKALRSGIFAGYAIADLLNKSDASGLEKYRKLVRREFAAYRRAHAEYCAAEDRWPDRPFWSRRRKESVAAYAAT